MLFEYSDRLSKMIRKAFIRVEAEDPIVLRPVHRKLLLCAESRPRIDDNASATLFGDLARGIGGIRIDDYDLVGPGHRLTGAFDVLLFVEGDNCGADLHPLCHKKAQKHQKHK